jgi:hypothetical protein
MPVGERPQDHYAGRKDSARPNTTLPEAEPLKHHLNQFVEMISLQRGVLRSPGSLVPDFRTEDGRVLLQPLEVCGELLERAFAVILVHGQFDSHFAVRSFLAVFCYLLGGSRPNALFLRSTRSGRATLRMADIQALVLGCARVARSSTNKNQGTTGCIVPSADPTISPNPASGSAT